MSNESEVSNYFPVTNDESRLVGLLFDKITSKYPDWEDLGERSGLAMEMFATVKRWAHTDAETGSVLNVKLPEPHVYRLDVVDPASIETVNGDDVGYS